MGVERPRVDLAQEIVQDLMGVIRGQFCADLDDKTWFKDHYHFIRKNVVMWPAAFMYGKGFTVPGERFKAILMGVLDGVKTHGNTGLVRQWEYYLMTCVQRHFRAHWEEYYAEAKSARALAEHTLLALGRLPKERAIDSVAALAAAHKVASPGRRRRSPCKAVKQMHFW